MLKGLMAALVVVSSGAFAAGERPGAVDAFLSSTVARPLVDARGLSPSARAALAVGQVSSTEPRFGVPTFFWSAPRSTGRSLRDQGLTPAQAARRYLVTHAELYRGDARRWAEAQVSQVHDLKDGSAVIVTFQQRVNGVRVFRDELKVIMNARLELVALSGYLTPELKLKGSFALASGTAVASAYEHLTGRALAGEALLPLGTFEGGYEHFKLAGTSTPVRARAVYFPLPDGLVPGFYVELELPAGEADSLYYSFVISAVDGALLYRKNLTADAFTYKVWADRQAPFLPFDGPQGSSATPHPTGTPNSFDPGTVQQQLVTLDHAGLSTGDPWLAPGATQTIGNNVRAYADLASPNGYSPGSADVLPSVSSADTFEFTYDFAVSPDANNAAQRSAAITQLFFDNNLFHDWYYDDGFNEAAGNAQQNNFARGGIGNDALRAEAQDYSGRSNANMSTPSDGAAPRMQMYIFDGADAASLTANLATPQAFNTLGADFGPQVFNVTAPLMLANDGDATPADACAALPSGSATGKLVLIDRGTCTFVQKVANAQAAGAVGVIIANNQAGGPMPLAGSSTTLTIPSMSVSQNSGNTLKGIITNGGGATTVTLKRDPASNRDGTLDNGVVGHEWGHYISNRLIGDGNGISNLQAVGMGEGWADFHAALFMAREGDAQVASNQNWSGAYGLAGWAGFSSDPNGYYFGFRRYPLSWDMAAKNPLMFKHIANGQRLPTGVPAAFGQSGASNAEVHNTGEVWAVMLWDCYVGLLRDSRYTFPQAQARMKRYLVAAYKATALMPTFVDARDAVLAVAAAQDMTDFGTFWAAFARRGLGMGAVAPDRDSQTNSPLTESTMVGNAVMVTEVTVDDATTSCDNDGNLDANEAGFLTIKLKNTGIGALTQSQVAVTANVMGLSFPMGASATLPATQPFGVTTVRIPVSLGNVAGIQGASFTITVTDASLARGPVMQMALFRLNYDLLPASSRVDDVEAPMTAWTAASDPQLTTGADFRIFQSTATEHYWFGPNPASPADTSLTSPDLAVGAGPLSISFRHRWDFEADAQQNYDGAVLEVSSDGRTWTDVGAQAMPGYNGQITTDPQSSNPLRSRRAFVGKSNGYPAFIAETINLGTMFAGRTVKFRFRIGADDAAAAKGWEIDDIQLSGITNKPFSSITSDPNTCTNRAPTATIGPDIEVFEREQVALVGSGTDPDMDTVTLNWVQTSGPMVILSNGTFTAPDVQVDASLTFQLTVTDGRAVTMPLEQTVLVKNLNRAPIATVPVTQEALMGDAVTVLGSGTDADGDAISYEWSQVSGPTVQLAGATTDTVTFTAPEVASSEVVRLQLVVRDAALASAPAVVDVVVKNPNPVVPPDEQMPKGCGCTSGLELLPLAALGLVLRSRRRR